MHIFLVVLFVYILISPIIASEDNLCLEASSLFKATTPGILISISTGQFAFPRFFPQSPHVAQSITSAISCQTAENRTSDNTRDITIDPAIPSSLKLTKTWETMASQSKNQTYKQESSLFSNQVPYQVFITMGNRFSQPAKGFIFSLLLTQTSPNLRCVKPLNCLGNLHSAYFFPNIS